jgi:lysophospholipase L1-like esterase
MAPYAAMEARLAVELPGVELFDASAALAPYAAEGLLFDRNHLSRAGSERMAEQLAPRVAAFLGLPSTPASAGSDTVAAP